MDFYSVRFPSLDASYQVFLTLPDRIDIKSSHAKIGHTAKERVPGTVFWRGSPVSKFWKNCVTGSITLEADPDSRVRNPDPDIPLRNES
jgi:hypothetical protein